MRRIEAIINDIRFSTNETDNNRFKDIRFNKLFSDAQEEIQRVIHTSNTNAKFFTKEVVRSLVNGTELYDLPDDIYTQNAVNGMARRVSVNNLGSEYFSPLRQLTEKERRQEIGYVIQGNQYIISPIPRINLDLGIRINYAKKMPRMSIRIGQIQSIVSNVISLELGFTEEDITLFDDFCCIVSDEGVFDTAEDSLGNTEPINVGLKITSYNSTTGEITLDASTLPTGTIVGKYITLGKMATTHSQLPDGVEPLLTMFVERKIFAINSSSDIKSADIFTGEEKSDIINLFAHNDHDAKYPPIVDNNYLNY